MSPSLGPLVKLMGWAETKSLGWKAGTCFLVSWDGAPMCGLHSPWVPLHCSKWAELKGAPGQAGGSPAPARAPARAHPIWRVTGVPKTPPRTTQHLGAWPHPEHWAPWACPYPDVVEGVALVVCVIDEAVPPVVPLRQWDAQPRVHVLQKLAAVLDSLQGQHPG